MAQNLVKITILFVSIYQVTQLCQANPAIISRDTSNVSVTEKASNLTPTDPMDINKMAFHPLLQLYGKVGPFIYTLLTEDYALGEQMSVVSKLIADKIGLENYTKDMELIFSNALNPEVRNKVSDIYEKIKDIEVQGTTGRKLKNAVEIITNVFNDDNAVNQMIDILKTKEV